MGHFNGQTFFDTEECCSDTGEGDVCITADAIAWVVLGNVSSLERELSSMAYLNSSRHTNFGTPLTDCDAPDIWPFAGYAEVLARYQLGQDALAIDLIRREWGNITTGQSLKYFPQFKRVFSLPKIELAAGMSAGAAPALTNYVLGVKPTSPGFATYDVIPRVADLAWANGAIQTPHGNIAVSWTTSSKNFTLCVSSPPGTEGRLGAASGGIITLNGKKVWDGTAYVSGCGYSATVVGNFVVVGGITSGSHTLVRTSK